MPELHLIAHNLRSRENVGSLFRSADSLGITQLWLTGYTPAPPDEKISKVALGAELVVSWRQCLDVQQVLRDLCAQGIPIFALELTPQAIDLASFVPPPRLALLLGTETTGVPPSLLDECAGAIKITQRGLKESLNVAVAAAIASWSLVNYAHSLRHSRHR